VTVLFADVSGFTSLSERLDPEDVRSFQNDLFTMLAEAIEQYGGFVEKFVGDAVMAVFGAPVAHEDDPDRALRAALGILERAHRLSERWEMCFGGPVQLHLGINTGPVVAGRLGGGGDAAYAVTGDTVNTAARLLSASEEGQILVSGTTRQLTGQAYRLRSAAGVCRSAARPSPSRSGACAAWPTCRARLSTAKAAVSPVRS
jgi:class 3 adenylate cyclase